MDKCTHEITHMGKCAGCSEDMESNEKSYDGRPQSWEERLKSEASIFWGMIEAALPKSFEMAALGKEKIYRAFYPAYVEFRKYMLQAVVKELAEEIEKNRMKGHANVCPSGLCEKQNDYDEGVDFALEVIEKYDKNN